MLQWQQVSGATGYELQVDGVQVVINKEARPATHHLIYGYHNWRARTKNSNDTYGSWSSSRGFHIYRGHSPSAEPGLSINGATITNLVLQWDQVTEATGYELLVVGIQVIVPTGSQTSYTPESRILDTTTGGR